MKKSRAHPVPSVALPSWKPPTPKERVRQAAEDFARTVAEVSPQTKRLRDQVLREALRAAKAPRGRGDRDG